MPFRVSFADAGRQQQPEATTRPAEREIADVAGMAKPRALAILDYLFPGGRVIAGEWHGLTRARGGPGDGIKYNMQTGMWGAFNGALNPDHGGDIVSLWAAARGCNNAQAARQIEAHLGIQPLATALVARPRAATAPAAGKADDGDDWTQDASARSVARYMYRDAAGEPFAEAYRYTHNTRRTDKGKPVKTFRVWDPRGRGRWYSKAGGHPIPDPRPLYRLPEIMARPGEPVCVVEGEKKADALLAAGILATSCLGGGNGVPLADWSPLAGRKLAVWPDHDLTATPDGKIAADSWTAKVAAELGKLRGVTAHRVVPPADKPDTWDAADATEAERRELVAVALSQPAEIATARELRIEDWDVTAFDADPAPIEFLIDETIPAGMPSLFVGVGGAGKGMTLLDLALKVAGPPPAANNYGPRPSVLGKEVRKHGAVVIVAAEDAADDVARRLKSLDPDGSRRKAAKGRLFIIPFPNLGGAPILWREGENGQPEASPEWLDLRRKIIAIPNLALVGFDPIAAFAAVKFDTEINAANFITGQAAALATETGAAVPLFHHMRKDGGGKGEAITTPEQARNSVLGSVGLVNGVRLAYALFGCEDRRAEAALRAAGREPTEAAKRGDVMCGAVIKKNIPVDMTIRTLVRNAASGVLEDFTTAARVQTADADDDRLKLLIEAVKLAAWRGTPFTTSKLTRDLRGMMPPPLNQLAGPALRALVDAATTARLLVVAQKGSLLDLPGGKFATATVDLDRSEAWRTFIPDDEDRSRGYVDDLPDDDATAAASSPASGERPCRFDNRTGEILEGGVPF